MNISDAISHSSVICIFKSHHACIIGSFNSVHDWSQHTDLYKGLEQTLCERTKGTSVFWRFMLGLWLFQQGVHIYSSWAWRWVLRRIHACSVTTVWHGNTKGSHSRHRLLPHLLHPAQTAALPWGSFSCRWLVLLPSAPPADPPEPTAESSVSPELESTVYTDSTKAQRTSKIILLLNTIKTHRSLAMPRVNLGT